MVARSGLVFQNRLFVSGIALLSSHSEVMLSVGRVESHSSRGWQRWPTQCGHLECENWSVCTSKVCSRYLRKTLRTESRLENTVRLNLNTHIEPNIMCPFGAETNSYTSYLDMLARFLSMDAYHSRACAVAMASLWFLGADDTLHAFGVSRS